MYLHVCVCICMFVSYICVCTAVKPESPAEEFELEPGSVCGSRCSVSVPQSTEVLHRFCRRVVPARPSSKRHSQSKHLTEDLSVVVVVVLGLQGLKAQLSAAGGHGVVDALQAAPAVSPQPLQPGRTDGGQELGGGEGLQRQQRRRRQQQALRDRH